MWAKPVTSVAPQRALNSSNSLPSMMRAMISRTSKGLRASVGITPYSSCASSSGGRGACSRMPCALLRFSRATLARASASAWLSSCARWSATPLRRVCTSPPPRSSALTTSPVAAFTSGGPPRKMVPCSLTMMDSSLHGRHVGAARGARAHHHRDLRDAFGAHLRLVEEDVGRSGRGRGRLRPGWAGWRRRCPPGRRRAGGFCCAISCARRCFFTVIG